MEHILLLAMNEMQWLMSVTLAIIIFIVVAAFIKNRYFNSNSVEKKSKKLDFDLGGFFRALGGKDNVVAVDNHQSRLILQVLDYDQVDFDSLKAYGASGITKTSKKLTLVIGSKSDAVKKFIDSKINKKKK